jgi:hypothetical protein
MPRMSDDISGFGGDAVENPTISRVPATNLELAGHILAFGRERADRLNALIKQFRHVCNH